MVREIRGTMREQWLKRFGHVMRQGEDLLRAKQRLQASVDGADWKDVKASGDDGQMGSW